MEETQIQNQESVNHWIKINSVLNHYRVALIVTATASLLLALCVLWLINRDTVVISVTQGNKAVFYGQRTTPEITESDVEGFARQYISMRYSWDEFSLEHAIKELAAFTTDGLLDKLKVALTQGEKVIREKKISQVAVIRWVKLEKATVRAGLDQLLTVADKVKVVDSMEVSLTIIKGRTNKMNPLGLYVNSITEYRSGAPSEN